MDNCSAHHPPTPVLVHFSLLHSYTEKNDMSLGGVAPSMTPKTTDSQCPIEATQDRLRQNPPCHSCVGATTILGNISLFKFASETNGCPWRARPRHPALRSTAHLRRKWREDSRSIGTCLHIDTVPPIMEVQECGGYDVTVQTK